MQKEKYKFLLSMKSLEYEIRQLTVYSSLCSDCFELLKRKLDDLCRFMTSSHNERQWLLWENHEEVRTLSCELRETSVQALCDFEKFQSLCICEKKINVSDYTRSLTGLVRADLEQFGIDKTSKVLFIGSGAFPVTALTIAQEAGSDVMCLDIDAEAVMLGQAVAGASGLAEKVRFSGSRIHEIAFGKEATHIIIASLVPNKLDMLEEVKTAVHPEAKIVLRYGNGIKSVFNYPMEEKLFPEWRLTKLNRPNAIYDTMILERSVKGMML